MNNLPFTVLDVGFFAWLAAIFAMAGALMFTMTVMAESEDFKKYRIRIPKTYRIPAFKRMINVLLNAVLALCVFAFGFFHFETYLVGQHSAGLTLMFGEALLSLMCYDFMYYFFHRTMHHPKLMKYVHGVHHYVRFPTSFESIYLHPLEGIGGIVLLLLGVAIVGPISVGSLLVVIFIHTMANILVHSNLILPHPIFKLFNYWATKHDYHHNGYLNRNYASIFPFWDMMFGTYK